MEITLLGYMGSGKSFIGKFLSSKLKLPFYDLDDLIEEKVEKSIKDIFSENGEIYFRKLEQEVLVDFYKEHSKDYILSLGGGTPCYYDNIKLVNKETISFYLNYSPSLLTSRLLSEKDKRPIVKEVPNEDLTEYIAKHLFERNTFYNQATYTLYLKDESKEEIVKEIINNYSSSSI